MSLVDESTLQPLLSRYAREHSSYKYWHARVLDENPTLYELSLYWHILSFDDNLQLLHYPSTKQSFVGPLSENLTSEFFESFVLSASEAPSLPTPQAVVPYSGPMHFVFQAPRNEQRAHRAKVLNHLHPAYIELKEELKARNLTAFL